jgi:hypothetical protein
MIRGVKEAIFLAEYVVAGIARTSDPAQLEKILMGCAELNSERLAVITKAQLTTAHDESPLRFVHSTGSGMSTGSGGTGVPGISSGGSVNLSSLAGRGHAPNYLRNIAIPRDVAENYNIAIDEGRSVVTYRANPDESSAAEQTFRSCGLVNVKTFKPRTPSGTETGVS